MNKDILTKKPFTRPLPIAAAPRIINTNDYRTPYKPKRQFIEVPQAQFIADYETTGHIINSQQYYPDPIKKDENTGEYYREQRFRAAFPFQKIIHTQQVVHLVGNDIHHELNGNHNSKTETELFHSFKKGWLAYDMEIAFYELAAAAKKLGDAATCFYIKDRKPRWRTFSYDNGDTIFPHYNDDGELTLFARLYNAFDRNQRLQTTFVEVWDSTTLTRYRRAESGIKGIINRVADFFDISGFVVDMPPTPHGFTTIPIVYYRDDGGACWSASQDAIDKYELAVSHLCQNNAAYAFPIMVLKGEEIEVKADIYKAVKAIDMGVDGKAEYLEPQGNVAAFKEQLDVLLKLIFQGSFAVLPPEIKSGDVPGVTVKLIYSPSIDQATCDSKDFQRPLRSMIDLFKYAYGMSLARSREMQALDTYSWIEPYVHQNTAEIVQNLVSLHGNGLISAETASALHGYGENNEFDKIMREMKEQQQQDLLIELGNTNPDVAHGEKAE